jgi:glutaredoxin
MSLPCPAAVGFTVFTKQGCPGCDKVKSLLESKGIEFKLVACDDFLTGAEREPFLQHLTRLTRLGKIQFPLVFHDEAFVGGFVATRDYIDNACG